MRKSVISSFPCALLVLFFIQSGRAGYHLVHEGRSPYVIVVAEGASPSEQHAARELQHFLKAASGVFLPIVPESNLDSPKPPCICLGFGRMARVILEKIGCPDEHSLGDEGFIIRTGPDADGFPDIVIAGSRLRGTLYGVYTFLESLGFRWYTGRVTKFPESKELPFGAVNQHIVPHFIYREPYIYEAFDGGWAARNRVNSLSASLEAKHGGRMGVLGVHTFGRLIPYNLYPDHPEYFPLIGGARVTGYVQRCLSNRELVRNTADAMDAWIRENPSARIYCLSAEDTENICECGDCVRIMEREEAPSGLYLQFVNEVADRIAERHPDKFISTLAYRFTEKPPKTIRPRKNVIVRLCPIDICLSHPLTECTDTAPIKFYGDLVGWSEMTSKKFYEHLRGWAGLTDRLFIWHYATDFKNLLMPFPDFKEFCADLKTYYRNGVIGIFFQGTSFGPGGSDSDLRAWIMAQLLWNPELDADAAINEWMQGVYGNGWKPMRDYFDLMHSCVESPERHLHLYDPVSPLWWTGEMVRRMDDLHAEALSLVPEDTTAQYYIRKSRVAVKYLQFTLGTGTLEIDGAVYRPKWNSVNPGDYKDFISQMGEFGITELRENAFDSDLIDLLRQRVETHPVVSIENELLRIDAVPSLGGRLVSIIHKPTGRNLLNNLSPSENYYPVTGGYEESTARTWGSTGFANSYTADIRGDTLVMQSAPSRGLEFIRCISIGKESPALHISSTLVNTSETASLQKLICRMYLKADPSGIAVAARNENGGYAPPRYSERRGGLEYGTSRYDGQNKPRGSWKVENIPGGLTTQHEFDDDAVESCILTAIAADSLVLMEVQTPARVLEPGGRITLNHTWRILDR